MGNFSGKKVLFIHDYPHSEGGGVEVQTYTDAQALITRGHEVTIATTRITSETLITETKHDGSYVKKETIESFAKLRTLIDQNDIIHIHATFSLRPGMMMAMKLLEEKKRNYFVTIQTTINHLPFSRLALESPLTREGFLEEFTARIKSPFCTIIGVSKILQESLDALGIKKSMEIIYNAKQWEIFKPDPQQQKPTVDISYIGELSWMKGLHILLDALSILQNEDATPSVRIIGNGQDAQAIQALVVSLRLTNISFVPYVPNRELPNYLVATKTLVIPSLTESWGNIAMEALGLGKLVIASKTEGLIELTRNGKFGLLFDRGNPADLARKIKMALDDALTKKRYTRAAIKRTITQEYTIKRRIDALEKIYANNGKKPQSAFIPSRTYRPIQSPR